MKFDEKLHKISEKSQGKMDRVAIILGVSLLVACFTSFFALQAFGEEEIQLVCPDGAYHGLDNQGNQACRDILTNEILEPEPQMSTDSSSEKTADSGRGLITNSGRGEIISVDQSDFSTIGLVSLIGIIAAIGVIFRKQIISGISQISGWSQAQKEQIRANQYGMCNICYRKPSRWVYDHIDGNRRNKDISNCQGLCPECKSEKTMIRI